ncbi:MAG: multiprotein bridging factor aMBF1 [Candidatus Methanofastidiosia archaeon]
MRCEMCGREIKGRSTEILVEGARLMVCGGCSRYGSVVSERKRDFHSSAKTLEKEVREEYDIVENYPHKVRRAREMRNLTQKELAKRINEKESVIHRIETGGMVPSKRLSKKLERFLEIKLVEKVEDFKLSHRKTKSEDLTIGDVIKFKKR